MLGKMLDILITLIPKLCKADVNNTYELLKSIKNSSLVNFMCMKQVTHALFGNGRQLDGL